MKKCIHLVAVESIGSVYNYHWLFTSKSKHITDNAEKFNYCPRCGEPLDKKFNVNSESQDTLTITKPQEK